MLNPSRSAVIGPGREPLCGPRPQCSARLRRAERRGPAPPRRLDPAGAPGRRRGRRPISAGAGRAASSSAPAGRRHGARLGTTERQRPMACRAGARTGAQVADVHQGEGARAGRRGAVLAPCSTLCTGEDVRARAPVARVEQQREERPRSRRQRSPEKPCASERPSREPARSTATGSGTSEVRARRQRRGRCAPWPVDHAPQAGTARTFRTTIASEARRELPVGRSAGPAA